MRLSDRHRQRLETHPTTTQSFATKNIQDHWWLHIRTWTGFRWHHRGIHISWKHAVYITLGPRRRDWTFDGVVQSNIDLGESFKQANFTISLPRSISSVCWWFEFVTKLQVEAQTSTDERIVEKCACDSRTDRYQRTEVSKWFSVISSILTSSRNINIRQYVVIFFDLFLRRFCAALYGQGFGTIPRTIPLWHAFFLSYAIEFIPWRCLPQSFIGAVIAGHLNRLTTCKLQDQTRNDGWCATRIQPGRFNSMWACCVHFSAASFLIWALSCKMIWLEVMG